MGAARGPALERLAWLGRGGRSRPARNAIGPCPADPDASTAPGDARARGGRIVGSALLEDREGNVWVGTNNGLERFRETKLTPVIFPGPISRPALAAGERGSVWVGGYSEYPLFWVGDSLAVHWEAPPTSRPRTVI